MYILYILQSAYTNCKQLWGNNLVYHRLGSR